MAADFYRSKLYRAERQAFRDQPKVARTLEDCRDRIEQVMRTKAWRAACSEKQLAREVKVVPGTGRTSWANSGRWEIAVSKGHLGTDWVMLHEACHLPTSNHFQAHGREFCALYLNVVEELYGPELRETLRAAMEANGVPYERTPKYERQLRSYLRLLAKPDYPAVDRQIVLTDGRAFYASDLRLDDDDDTVYLSRGYSAATPESVHLREIAYVTWRKENRDWL